MIDPAGALGRTLVAVAGLMEEARDPWWIIGSAAVALHGRDPGEVGDVDLLASERDAAAMLERRGRAAMPGGRHPRFRSAIFARLAGMPLPIEVMAGFAVAGPAGWRTVTFAARDAVTVGGAPLFVPPIAELATLLTLFGRDKNLARAAAIAWE